MRLLIISALLLVCLSCNKNKSGERKIIELPLHLEDGFGPFAYEYAFVQPEYSISDSNGRPWNKMYQLVKGIPEDWKQVDKAPLSIDMHQLVYQHYFLGNVDDEIYTELQRGWKWIPDSTLLTKKPINCEVYMIWGIDKTGQWAVKVDTDNDLDFADEEAFYPETASKFTAGPYKLMKTVSYQFYRDGKVFTAQTPLVIQRITDGSNGRDFVYCFPQYVSAILTYNNQEIKLGVRRGFSSMIYETPEIAIIDKSENESKLGMNQGVTVGGILTLGSFPNKANFKNLGVDRVKNVLLLETLDSVNYDTYSLQKGFTFKPFKTKEFQTGESISLADYKGKYVYIDFWGTWCKGCVASFPELEKTYSIIDKSKVEFIGIACHNKPEQLEKFLKFRPLPWPQILSDSLNQLVEQYGIEGFPTTIFIGPDGKIIARNIAGESFKKELQRLKLTKI